jgi:hypothetical protein
MPVQFTRECDNQRNLAVFFCKRYPVLAGADDLAAGSVRLGPRGIAEQPFQGAICRTDAAPIQVSLVTATRHTVLRLASHIATSTDDRCFVNLQLEGGGAYRAARSRTDQCDRRPGACGYDRAVRDRQPPRLQTVLLCDPATTLLEWLSTRKSLGADRRARDRSDFAWASQRLDTRVLPGLPIPIVRAVAALLLSTAEAGSRRRLCRSCDNRTHNSRVTS